MGIVQAVHDEHYEELLLQKEEGKLLQEHKDSAGIKAYSGMVVFEEEDIQMGSESQDGYYASNEELNDLGNDVILVNEGMPKAAAEHHVAAVPQAGPALCEGHNF